MLVWPGFEPATSRSANRRSPNWTSQALKCSVILQKDLFKGRSSLFVTLVTQGLPSSSSAVLLHKFINDQKGFVPFSWRQNACQLLIRLDATSEHALRCSIWNQSKIITLNAITIVFNLHHMIGIMCIARAAFSDFESSKIHSVCNPRPLMLHELLSPKNVAPNATKRIPQKQYLIGD